MKQIWKPIKDYESYYLISSCGRVRSLRRCKNLAPRKHYRFNYVSVSVLLHKNNKGKETQISRLVVQAFIPNPENKEEVNHIDNDATNNRVENLDWLTHKENMQYAKKQGRIHNGNRHKKLSPLTLLRDNHDMLICN